MNSTPGLSDSPDNCRDSEEAALTQILRAKMQQEQCLLPDVQEAIAYRIAEIMVAAKELYTKELPRIMHESQAPADSSLFDDLVGLRMTLLHLHDLITDFDDAFLDAMTLERQASGTGEFASNPPNEP